MRHHSMLRWPTRILAGTICCASLMSGLAVRAADAPIAASHRAEDVARWIQELDADSFALREQATNKLREAGPAAVNALAQAIAGDSAEVSARASAILQRIADGSDEKTLDQVEAALQKLGSKRKAVLHVAADIRVQQQKFKHTRAVAQVRALGGGLTGNLAGEHHLVAEQIVLAGPGPVLIEEEVEIAPAIAIDLAPGLEIPAAAEEAPAPPKRGLLGLLARLIAPEAAPPPPAAIPAEFFPVPADIPPDAIVPVDAAPPAEAVPAPPPPAEAIPRFEERPDLPAPADVPLLVPPPADAPAVDLGEVEPFDAADVMLIEPAFAPGPFMIGDMEEGEAYAELTLNKNFRGSDQDLAVLKDIPEIYSLSISGAKLTDAALPHIAALPRLTTLNLRDTPFSSAALRQLRQQRPELSIICRSPAMLGINAGLDGPCVLTSVFFKSGAYDAGLRDGDEIVEVDGQKVGSFSDLTIAVYPHQPGDKVSVKFRRDDAEKTVEVTLKPRAAVEE